MAINLNDYEFRTYYDAHGLAENEGCFLAEVIGWEAIMGDGQTPDEAVRMCREVLGLNIRVNLEKGKRVPPPVCGVAIAAAAFGRLGGRSRSPAKLAAQRKNALKGGRPKGSKNRPKAAGLALAA